jgi:hypothetical protein
VSLRNYGEFVRRDRAGHWVANKPSLALYTCAASAGWDLDIPDQQRVDAWLAEFKRCEAADSLPRLTILRLPERPHRGCQIRSASLRALVRTTIWRSGA